MSYDFPPDIDERVKARMIHGAYGSEDDVLREAMDALDERETEKRHRWREQNNIAIEQSRLGLSKTLDLDGVLARVETRLAERRQAE